MPSQTKKPRHLKAKTFYRNRWAINIGPTVDTQSKLDLSVHPIRVLQRFPGGMVYESAGKPYLLAEHVFGDYPFFFVFRMPGDTKSAEDNLVPGTPDQVMQPITRALAALVKNVRLPANLHNVEADITQLVAKNMQLPAGWEIAKTIVRIGVQGGAIACDCDVDGPCGYCCDTCDCNTCELPFESPAIEAGA
jgi:hypothetical protein